ncbi:hypothetical protein ACFPC0_10505 [Streptomyces andamanensis]|uniref:Uncharacterized protein n=1 Tax=Streptomyces andamanensis TaxID=1565035 RepID=A0ABV8TC91_9ACTN
MQLVRPVICAYCDQPIRTAQPYDTPETGSGVAGPADRTIGACQPAAPQQTAPEQTPWWQRQ